MQKSLDEARDDVQRMKAERDLFAENMKKAFMRGVCALNVEAMTMFHSGGGGAGGAVGDTSDSSSSDSGPGPGNPPSRVSFTE